MKLCELELEQFRKFDRPLRITGMAAGLNLIVGPNEMGKSTLFAALQAVLFERHRSQAQTVKSFQPAGHEGASPRVALTFEIAGRPYRIEKRFLRRPSAELALPDGRHLHGEAAEEALDGLLAGGLPRERAAGRRAAERSRGAGHLEPALGRPGPVVRPAGAGAGGARHLADRPRGRGRRGPRRRSRRHADQDDRAGAVRAGLPGGTSARPLQGGGRRPPGASRSRSPTSRPDARSSSGI